MLEHARVVRVGRAGVEVSLRVVPPPPPRAGVDPVFLGQHVAAAVERAEVGVVRAEDLDLPRRHDDARLAGGVPVARRDDAGAPVRARLRAPGQGDVGRCREI